MHTHARTHTHTRIKQRKPKLKMPLRMKKYKTKEVHTKYISKLTKSYSDTTVTGLAYYSSKYNFKSSKKKTFFNP